jgi:hypothetical protein
MHINNTHVKGYPKFASWYDHHGSSDLHTTLLNANKVNPDWSRWLFTRLMNRKQCLEIAIFSAEQVLDVYERKYPNDPRPRNAIDAARKVLKNDTEENRNAAYAAASAAYVAYAAAYAAADAANAARYAAYAANAVDAAFAAYYAASAAANAAAHAAYAASNPSEMRTRIINEAVRILDREAKPKLNLPEWY